MLWIPTTHITVVDPSALLCRELRQRLPLTKPAVSTTAPDFLVFTTENPIACCVHRLQLPEYTYPTPNSASQSYSSQCCHGYPGPWDSRQQPVLASDYTSTRCQPRPLWPTPTAMHAPAASPCNHMSAYQEPSSPQLLKHPGPAPIPVTGLLNC